MSFQEMEIKTEIEIVEDWKPSVPAFHGQNELPRSDLNVSENPNDDIDISIGSVFKLKVEGIIFFLLFHFFLKIIVILEFNDYTFQTTII